MTYHNMLHIYHIQEHSYNVKWWMKMNIKGCLEYYKLTKLTRQDRKCLRSTTYLGIFSTTFSQRSRSKTWSKTCWFTRWVGRWLWRWVTRWIGSLHDLTFSILIPCLLPQSGLETWFVSIVGAPSTVRPTPTLKTLCSDPYYIIFHILDRRREWFHILHWANLDIRPSKTGGRTVTKTILLANDTWLWIPTLGYQYTLVELTRSIVLNRRSSGGSRALTISNCFPSTTVVLDWVVLAAVECIRPVLALVNNSSYSIIIFN